MVFDEHFSTSQALRPDAGQFYLSKLQECLIFKLLFFSFFCTSLINLFGITYFARHDNCIYKNNPHTPLFVNIEFPPQASITVCPLVMIVQEPLLLLSGEAAHCS